MQGLLDHLREDLKREKRQLQEAVAYFHQTKGRIQYLNHWISSLEKDSFTLDEFAEFIAGEGATAEIDDCQ